MQCHASRRSHEQACARDEFWGVISTLTNDLTKARNQLARLIKLGAARRLFGGDCGTRPPPCAASQLPNCHRLGCGKQYPHYNNRSPSPRRPPCRRPVTFCGANSSRHPVSCGGWTSPRTSPARPSWSFEQPQERVQYSCERESRSGEYSRAPEAPYSCERQENCGRSRSRARGNSNCVEICINPDPSPARRRRRSPSMPCRGGAGGPARLQGGGRGRDCIATQFAALLQDVTCQLRERRLAAAEEGRF